MTTVPVEESTPLAVPQAAITTTPPSPTLPSTGFQEEEGDEAAEGVRKTPFTHPVASVSLPSAPELSTEQTTKYNSVLNTVASWTHVPTSAAKDSPQEPITEEEQEWLTRECLLRYLRATKWDVPQATNRIMATLSWRREYGITSVPGKPSKLSAEYISPENETGKQWIEGYDINGRPCHYLNPARQNTERSERQIEHLVYLMERDIDIMPPGQETLALLINFAEATKGQGATIQQGRQVLNILQSHYPERLGRALLIKLPWWASAFVKLVSPFIDPLTRQKIVFNADLRQHIPASQLLKPFGGDLDFEYDHSIYWPALDKMVVEKRKTRHERWVRGGSRVGELEMYLKGGQEDGLGDLLKDRPTGQERQKEKAGDGSPRRGALKVNSEEKIRKSVSIYEGEEGSGSDDKAVIGKENIASLNGVVNGDGNQGGNAPKTAKA